MSDSPTAPAETQESAPAAAADLGSASVAGERATAVAEPVAVSPLPLSDFGSPSSRERAAALEDSPELAAISLLDDVELEVKIELGRAQMYIEDVLRLGVGSVIELDKLAGDPVDVFINERLVARGEVLVLNENLCVRINEIVNPTPEIRTSPMNLRIAVIALIVLTTAPSAVAQDSAETAESTTPDAALDASGEAAALDAAWSMVESKKPAEPGKTIRRRGVSPKTDRAATSKTQPAASGSWMRSIGSLGAVVAVILFLAWGAKSLTRDGPLTGRPKRSGVIEIISRTALSPKQSLCLVRVGPRMVLVGVTQESLRTLDVIQDADAIAALAGEATATRSADAERAFRASLEQETVTYEAPTALPAATVGCGGMNDVRKRLSAALTRVKGAAHET